MSHGHGWSSPRELVAAAKSMRRHVGSMPRRRASSPRELVGALVVDRALPERSGGPASPRRRTSASSVDLVGAEREDVEINQGGTTYIWSSIMINPGPALRRVEQCGRSGPKNRRGLSHVCIQCMYIRCIIGQQQANRELLMLL